MAHWGCVGKEDVLVGYGELNINAVQVIVIHLLFVSFWNKISMQISMELTNIASVFPGTYI